MIKEEKYRERETPTATFLGKIQARTTENGEICWGQCRCRGPTMMRPTRWIAPITRVLYLARTFIIIILINLPYDPKE